VNLCLVPWPYAPAPVPSCLGLVCIPDESPLFYRYRSSFLFTSLRKLDCELFVEYMSWYHFVSPSFKMCSFIMSQTLFACLYHIGMGLHCSLQLSLHSAASAIARIEVLSNAPSMLEMPLRLFPCAVLHFQPFL
jgi:hypothetical protein